MGPRLLPVDVPWSQMLLTASQFQAPAPSPTRLPGAPTSLPLFTSPGGKLCAPPGAVLHGDRHLEDAAARQAAQWKGVSSSEETAAGLGLVGVRGVRQGDWVLYGEELRSQCTRVAGEREGRWSPARGALRCLSREPSKEPLEGVHDQSGVLAPPPWGQCAPRRVQGLT